MGNSAAVTLETYEVLTMEPSERRDQSVDESFRVAMSRLAAGVVMVTCHVEGKPWGLTVSACCSVSMEPPLILVSLGNTTASAHAIADQETFGVSVLGEGLMEVARFGSSRGEPKFLEHLCAEDLGTCVSPAVAGAMAHVDCSVERRVPAGDHVIFIGLVQNVVLADGDSPLVYHGRTYHRLAPSTDLRVGPVTDETVDSLLYDYPVPRHFARVQSPGIGASETSSPPNPNPNRSSGHMSERQEAPHGHD
jgi:flavin reductase (DIM6/NTAB) family NADH-FMN oxidoreductase RutF